MSGHAEDVHRAGAHFHDKQNVESAQRERVEGKEICGQQSGGLGSQECSPAGLCSAGCGPEVRGSEDPADRSCAKLVSKPGEFALDAAVLQLPCLKIREATLVNAAIGPWGQYRHRLIHRSPRHGVVIDFAESFRCSCWAGLNDLSGAGGRVAARWCPRGWG
jgi:hypothetical protein